MSEASKDSSGREMERMRGDVGALETGKKYLTNLRTFVGLPAGHSRVRIGQTLV